MGNVGLGGETRVDRAKGNDAYHAKNDNDCALWDGKEVRKMGGRVRT